MKIQEILRSTNSSIAIEGAFLAIKILKQRLGIATTKTDNSFEIPADLPREAVERVSNLLIQEFEREEGVPADKLQRTALLRHVDLLSGEVQRLSLQDSSETDAEATIILDEMRHLPLQ